MEIKQAQPNKNPVAAAVVAAMVNEPRSIPFSQEAEEACIGAVLIAPNYYYEVALLLEVNDFYLLRHRLLWTAITNLMERKSPLDIVTIGNELKALDALNDIGGPAYVMQLINTAPDSNHAVVYAHIVRNAAIRRQLMAYGDEVKEIAANDKTLLSDVVGKIETKQVEIISRFTGEKTHKLSVAYAQHYERTELLFENPQEVTGIPTGFTDLDHYMQGLQPGSSTLIGARPGMGKTSIMLNLATNVAALGYRVGFFSMEMNVQELVNRLAAAAAGIDTLRLRSGNINSDEWHRYVKVAGEQAKLPLYIDDTSVWTVPQLKAKCISMKRRHGLDLVFIDYVGLLSAGGAFKDNKVAQAGVISRSLKQMSQELAMPLVSAIQLSRKCEDRADKRPQLSDLRDSGDYEQDADNVLFLYRDEVYNPDTAQPGAAELIIAKQRGGPIGTIPLYFEKSHTRFMNARQVTI
jgi:replicative DNA helicase